MTEAWYYKPGDHYVLDDISGFKIRHSRARKIPGGQTGGMLVETKRWEPQHPQDFVRGVVDEQMVPEARPRQKNRFTIVGTWVTTPAARLTRWITVDSTEGFNEGDKVSVMLDSGENYFPVVVRISGNQFFLTPVLPHGVGGNFADPLENVVVDLGPSGETFLISDDAGAGEPFIVDDLGDLLATP